MKILNIRVKSKIAIQKLDKGIKMNIHTGKF